jgi:hypothetical protein
MNFLKSLLKPNFMNQTSSQAQSQLQAQTPLPAFAKNDNAQFQYASPSEGVDEAYTANGDVREHWKYLL